MPAPSDAVTLTLPRSALPAVVSLSQSLNDRMHELLERNTDGALSAIERAELETLVEMAQFGQIISMALQSATQP